MLNLNSSSLSTKIYLDIRDIQVSLNLALCQLKLVMPELVNSFFSLSIFLVKKNWMTCNSVYYFLAKK